MGTISWIPPADVSNIAGYTTWMSNGINGAGEVMIHAPCPTCASVTGMQYVAVGTNELTVFPIVETRISAPGNAGCKLGCPANYILVYAIEAQDPGVELEAGTWTRFKPPAILQIYDESGGVPNLAVNHVMFVDEDPSPDSIRGLVQWDPYKYKDGSRHGLMDTAYTTYYHLYLASSADGTCLRSEFVQPVPVGTNEFQIPTTSHGGRNFILVYAWNPHGLAASAAYYSFEDPPEPGTGPCDPVKITNASTNATTTTTTMSLAQRRTAGYTAKALTDAGYTYSVEEFKAAGYSASNLKDAGYSLDDLKGADYTAADLRDAGYTALELMSAGFSTLALKNAGYTAAELNDAGYLAADLQPVGYSANDLKGGGYTAGDLKAAGYAAEDLAEVGYSLLELKVAEYSALNLTAANYSAVELKDVGYSAADLVSAGFSA
jgi:uncharacterized protein YjbI with pentapeptide repeats